MINQRNKSFDILKCICAFLVICIHCPFPGEVGKCFNAIVSRIAVPCFFMISGYYYQKVKDNGKELKQLKKLCLLCLSAFIFCAAFSVINPLSSDGSEKFFFQKISARKIIGLVVFNATFVGFHLWFLFALVYVYLIVIAFDKIKTRKILYYAIPFLFIGNLLLGAYNGYIFGRMAMRAEYTRNFLFVGLPFFLTGDLIREKDLFVFKNKSYFIVATGVLLLSFAATFVEIKFLLGETIYDVYASTIISAVTVFVIFKNLNTENAKKPLCVMADIGQRHSTFIYVCQFITIMLFSRIGDFITSRSASLGSLFAWIIPILAFISLWVLSIAYHYAVRLLKPKKNADIK